ncbi:MAG: hypothetical protein ABH885_01035, partial [Candidatus Omnitrophota bacterium]
PVGTEFMGMDINSPGNDGETYMAVHGVADENNELMEGVRKSKIRRFRKTIEYLNSLPGLGLDISYTRDVQPLTEADNPTERHLSEAIARAVYAKFGEGNHAGIAGYMRRLISVISGVSEESALTTKDEATILNMDDFIVVIRDKVIKSMRKIHPPDQDENVSTERAVKYAHKKGGIVLGLYLGGPKPCEAERRDNGNLGKLFQYYKDMGIDGIGFMPNRNTPEEMLEVMALAREIGFKYIANGMDVNKPGMPFTYFDISCDRDLVNVTMQIARREWKMLERRPAKTAAYERVPGRIETEEILRDIADVRELPANMLELLISAALTKKKCVLSFDKNVKNSEALDLFRTLERLKNTSAFAALLGNLEVIPGADPQEIASMLEKYADDPDTLAFVFAPLTNRSVFERFESKVNLHTVYIDEKNYSQEYYYPLADIVTITLAEFLRPGTVSNIRKSLKDLGIKQAALNIDIRAIKRNKAGALIFAILPNVKRYEEGALDRHERMRQALAAA